MSEELAQKHKIVVMQGGKKDHIQKMQHRDSNGRTVYFPWTRCGQHFSGRGSVMPYRPGLRLDLCKICEKGRDL